MSLASFRFFSEYKTKRISNRSAKSEERWLNLEYFISASLKKYFYTDPGEWTAVPCLGSTEARADIKVGVQNSPYVYSERLPFLDQTGWVWWAPKHNVTLPCFAELDS